MRYHTAIYDYHNIVFDISNDLMLGKTLAELYCYVLGILHNNCTSVITPAVYGDLMMRIFSFAWVYR